MSNSMRERRKWPRGKVSMTTCRGGARFGTTVGILEGRASARPNSGRKYAAAALTAFGETIENESVRSTPTPSSYTSFYTGKPHVAGLGHVFLMRNYRASLAKWQTADPLGYPDGWNQLAYCNNGVTGAVDLWGCAEVIVETQWRYDDPFAVGYPMTSVFKFMKDTWDKGSVVMDVLKIKTVVVLVKKAREELDDKVKEKLKEVFDDGLWFDEMMKADSVHADGSAGFSGYDCVPPTDKEIVSEIEKTIGANADYAIVSVKLTSIDPDVDDAFSGAWFIKGCTFKWRVVYE